MYRHYRSFGTIVYIARATVINTHLLEGWDSSSVDWCIPCSLAGVFSPELAGSNDTGGVGGSRLKPKVYRE